MRIDPILRAYPLIQIERPPELWEADTEETRFLPLFDEVIAAAGAAGAQHPELVLNASNIVVEPPEDGEESMVPRPGEYVAFTVRGPSDLGPDATWSPGALGGGLLFRIHGCLEAAQARFAYVRKLPSGGSLTVFLARRKT